MVMFNIIHRNIQRYRVRVHLTIVGYTLAIQHHKKLNAVAGYDAVGYGKVVISRKSHIACELIAIGFKGISNLKAAAVAGFQGGYPFAVDAGYGSHTQ